MFFCNIKDLSNLESQNKWKEIINYLYNLWNIDKNSADLLLRLATETWFILTNAEVLNIDETTYSLSKKILKETFDYDKHYIKENKNKLMFGYMININPSYFCDDPTSAKEYSFLEKYGSELIKMAYLEDPSNMLNATLYYGINKNYEKQYKKSKNDLQVMIPSFFSDKTEVERYFIECLSAE